MIISETHMRLLKTQTFEKKGYLPSEGELWPIFSNIIESDEAQGTF